MATTMTLIGKQTVGANGAASVTFSNIPQTYTDLKVVLSTRNSAGTNSWDDIFMDINGSSSNFTARVLYGTGSAALSTSFSSSLAQVGEGNAGTANTFGNTEIYIPNYTSTTTAKSFSSDSVSENNATASLAQLGAGLFNPGTQAAITSLSFRTFTTGNFVSNSTFYLYGVSSNVTTQNTTVPYAYGGDIITTDGSFWYHAFRSSGSFVPQKALSADVLVIAGGGGGAGGFEGGAGGAGGIQYLANATLVGSTNYSCTVGGGGAGSAGAGGGILNGTNGVNSQISGSGFSTITANGGGGGGGYIGSAVSRNASAGGSGGGTGRAATGGASNQSSSGGATSYGNVGGNGGGTSPGGGTGGGGGAGGAGANSNGAGVGGVGGIGLTNAVINAIGAATGTGQLVSSNYYFAGGGGGADNSNAIAGGFGGGGASSISASGQNGTVNTGGGAGGTRSIYTGGSGGSGIVIVRYAV